MYVSWLKLFPLAHTEPPPPGQESKGGQRKVLATADVNLKRFASPTPTQVDLKLKLKPRSVKVVAATLQLTLSCVFLREGKAT